MEKGNYSETLQPVYQSVQCHIQQGHNVHYFSYSAIFLVCSKALSFNLFDINVYVALCKGSTILNLQNVIRFFKRQ
jgi:hypothetical protein